jgi:hypothetical protein
MSDPTSSATEAGRTSRTRRSWDEDTGSPWTRFGPGEPLVHRTPHKRRVSPDLAPTKCDGPVVEEADGQLYHHILKTKQVIRRTGRAAASSEAMS